MRLLMPFSTCRTPTPNSPERADDNAFERPTVPVSALLTPAPPAARAHHHIQKLSQARDFQDIIKIQTEYMQTQFGLFANQAKQLGEAYMNTAAGAFKPPFNA